MLKRPLSPRAHPLDRFAIFAMAALGVVILVIILLGDHAAARVRDCSWCDRKIGSENIAFMMTFTRPMDAASVEGNLTITPPLPGKFSWAGRRMAYTLDVPAPYGETFRISLDQARDSFSADESNSASFEAFESQFETRHRAFAYIGATGDEANRLVLNDLTQNTQKILTPENLIVLGFEPYPLGDKILLSAVDAATYQQGNLAPQLYTVSTGIPVNPPRDDLAPQSGLTLPRLFKNSQPAPAGEMSLILDNQGYQNLKFDLSPDGETIVVQRVNQENPADFGPWVIRNGQPSPLETEPGGDFLITPDSTSLLLLQGEGTAIIPLDETDLAAGTEPLDFLPDYGRVFDLKSDGTAAAMVNFNQDDPEKRYTESLFLVDNQGNEQQLMQVSGTIIDAQFSPTNQVLYVLASEVLPGENYVEQPLLSAINLEQETITDLLLLPPQQNLTMSLSPDGIALLLNVTTLQADVPPSQESQQIWLLPLFQTTAERLTGSPVQNKPEQLPLVGSMVAWLP